MFKKKDIPSNDRLQLYAFRPLAERSDQSLAFASCVASYGVTPDIISTRLRPAHGHACACAVRQAYLLLASASAAYAQVPHSHTLLNGFSRQIDNSR